MHRHLTWRRSLSGGIAAFALLALATTGFMVARNRGTLMAQDVISEGDRIVLADVTARNADVELASVLTEALRIDLLQSNVVRLAEPGAITDALRRMQQPEDAALTTELALHAAEREGWKAVIATEVGGAGGRYVLSARLLAVNGGTVLGVYKATAADSTELLDAVTELSKQLRGKVGESLKSLRASPALERVSTSSLAALRKYVAGSRAYLEEGERVRSLDLLDEAIALDSSFAMAWRRKGLFLSNIGILPAERNHALTRAFELSDRLPEKERLLATAAYLNLVQSNREGAIAAYRRVLELDSLDGPALNNLSLLYSAEGRWADAEQLLQRSVNGGHVSSNGYANLTAVKFRLGKIEEARAVVRTALAALPNNPDLLRTGAQLAAAELRWADADSITRETGERFRDNPTARLAALRDQTSLAQLQGRLRELPALGAEVHRLLKGFANLQLGTALETAESSLRIRGDAQRGLRELEEALRRVPLDSMPVGQRPFARLAELYADAGQFDRAESYVQLLVKRAPRADSAPGVLNARAYIAMLRGDGAPLVERHRSNANVNCPPCGQQALGRGYDVLGQRDSALAAYERFLTAPHWGRLGGDLVWRPSILIRAAELHEAAGNSARAKELYGEFIALWEHADPELQPRVAAAKLALGRLAGDRR